MRNHRRVLMAFLQTGLVTAAVAMAAAGSPTVEHVDQGRDWSPELRAAYYRVDQGARMIPLAWLRALRTAAGQPFLADASRRYGFLPANADAEGSLPVGFTTTASPQGAIVGLTCSACHVREITVDRKAYRIDGAPAFIDFGAFVLGLEEAVQRALADDKRFGSFAVDVLGAEGAKDAGSLLKLRAEVEAWRTRFAAWVDGSLPTQRKWGPARLDAMGMIFNRVAGLDIGPPPTFLVGENIVTADAPVRYPFLWNSAKQDYTQWAAFDPNGNDALALVRNLGQLYGVFGDFHPLPATAPLNRDYITHNSADFAGLAEAEVLLKRIGPPKWPWTIDRALAARGGEIFNRECAGCHGIEEGASRPPAAHTWKTRFLDVGTDTRQWQVLTRQVRTGDLEGASLPQGMPLKARDGALNVLKTVVVGALIDVQANRRSGQQAAKQDEPPAAPGPSMPTAGERKRVMSSAGSKTVYEARVLQGVWAAAPFLHNGSVPTLADLLEPPERRPRTFQVGSAYDPSTVGLARKQDESAFTLRTTGCEDRGSGDSNCGHDYGTDLPPAEKRALLEYLKAL